MSAQHSNQQTLTKINDHSAVKIELKNISKSFGENEVLRNIDLTFERGEFIAIIGKSGSGKSTLLRLIANLEKATAGSLLFDGVPASRSDKKVTMMYQDARLLPWKNVINNVGIGIDGDWTKQAKEALDAVGLLDFIEQWPKNLSGGQRQRVALARALIHEPALLMLDEPLSALDALTRIEMQNLIESIWLRSRFTTLLVTHDVGEAVRLADRIILIENGTIAMDKKIISSRPRVMSDSKLVQLEEEVLNRIIYGEQLDITEKKIQKVR